MVYQSDFLRILDERGFINQGSDLQGLDAALKKGPQGAYIGFDATAPSLHVGNLMGIMMLRWFQETGHKPYTLMGGGTTKVGDPSGKDESRKLLDDAAIDANIASIKQVFARFLTYGSGPQGAVMVNNDDWLKGLNYIEFLRDVGKHFSINRMLTMDSVRLRLEREQTLSFLEFNYMILQAYDFAELHKRTGLILQMGGSDQWGNIVNGVELGRRMGLKADLFALTCPLITKSDGSKMGKSAQGAIWLNEAMLSPYDYYQFWRNTDDSDVVRFLKFYTVLPMDEINRLAALRGAEINEAKKTLALEATALCHGRDAAMAAAETARKAFEEGTAGGDLPTLEVTREAAPRDVVECIVQLGFAPSKGEARRLIQGGGVAVNDTKISDPLRKIDDSDFVASAMKISVGKKKIGLIKIANG